MRQLVSEHVRVLLILCFMWLSTLVAFIILTAIHGELSTISTALTGLLGVIVGVSGAVGATAVKSEKTNGTNGTNGHT